jgi:signal transduction histidine kinase/DNA-binding NarL/FixJ family response regulator
MRRWRRAHVCRMWGGTMENSSSHEAAVASRPYINTVLLWLVLACLLPGVVGVAVLFTREYLNARAELERDTIATARAMVQAIDGQLSRAITTCYALSMSGALARGDLGEFHRSARELIDTSKVGLNFVLSDVNGQQLVNTLRDFGEPLPPHGNFASLRRVLATGQPVISDIYSGAVLRKPVMSVDVPVKAGDRVAYVLSIGLVPDDFNRMLAAAGFPPDWIAVVFDSSGTIAARTRSPEEFVGRKGTAEYTRSISQSIEGSMHTVTLEGIPTLSVWSRSPVTGWSVGIGIPLEVLERELRWKMIWLGCGLAVLLAVGLGLAWWAGRKIAGSVQALAAQATAMGKGASVLMPAMLFREAEDAAMAIRESERLLANRDAALTVANRALEKQISLLTTLLKNLTIGVFMVEAPSGKPLVANDAALRLLGPGILADTSGSNPAEVYPTYKGGSRVPYPPDQLPVRMGMNGVSSHIDDLVVERPDGTATLLELFGSPVIDERGQVWASLVSCFDISERKALEARLVEAFARARQQTEAKSAFLAHVSHEIRTPLHVIMGLGNLLLRDAGDSVQRDRLMQVLAASEHLLAIVNDLLDLSKIEAQRLVLNQIDFRLRTVIDNVVNIVGGQAREKGLTLSVDVVPEVRDMALTGDPLRLTQVLVNLCGNAVKFTDKGTVAMSVVRLAENDTKVTLHFTVEDTGIGMTSAELEHLFEPFTQGDRSTIRERGGTGLGLAISQQLIGLMGGRIRGDSELGAGSSFSFDLVLPRAQSLPNEPVPAVEPPTVLAGRRVLLADDHRLGRAVLSEMLRDLGCTVDVAADGTEALARARENSYDLILMDIEMPGMNGLDATRAIRLLPGHAATPVVALTANVLSEDRGRCFAAGMTGHLGKPVTPAALTAALHRYLSPAAVASPGDHGDDALRRTLAGIPGLDAGPVLSEPRPRLIHYCTRLQDFVTTQAQEVVRLRARLAEGDREGACRVAHDLPGAAGLLGAQRVAESAAEVYAALRIGSDEGIVASLLAAHEAELASLTEAVRTLPATESGGA